MTARIAIILNPRSGSAPSQAKLVGALDGEIHELDVPLRFSVKRGALRVIVPAETEG